MYDASGNRIGKVSETAANKKYTWYVRDGQGNILSVYTSEGLSENLDELILTQTERNIYGSSRLGTEMLGQGVDGGPWDAAQYYTQSMFERGRRQYELTNHLGNVLTTISDKKYGVSSDGSLIDYFEPDIVSGTEYYPFGMPLRGGGDYRYGFNGKENDNEVKGGGLQQDYGMRIYDSRLGRFLSVDPIAKDYPWYTPYQFAGNSPILNIDMDGLEPLGSSESIGAQKTATLVKLQSEFIYNSIKSSTNTNFEQVYRYTQADPKVLENEDNLNSFRSLTGRVRGAYGEGVASFLTISGLSETFSIHTTAGNSGIDVDISKKKTMVNSGNPLRVGEASYAHQNLGFDFTVTFKTGTEKSDDGKTVRQAILYNTFQKASGFPDPETYSDNRTYTFGIEVKTFNPQNSSFNVLGYEGAVTQMIGNFYKSGGMKGGALIPVLQTDKEAWDNAYERSPARMKQAFKRLEVIGGKLQLISNLYSGSNSQMQQTKREVNEKP